MAEVDPTNFSTPKLSGGGGREREKKVAGNEDFHRKKSCNDTKKGEGGRGGGGSKNKAVFFTGKRSRVKCMVQLTQKRADFFPGDPVF